MIACMGGWCRSRERCAHYYETKTELLTERLCGKEEEITDLGTSRSIRNESKGHGVPSRQVLRGRSNAIPSDLRGRHTIEVVRGLGASAEGSSSALGGETV
jgi:hypothetical protein